MSVKITCFVIFLFPSLRVTKSTEIPSTVFVIRIPASIRARHPSQKRAIDDERLDFKTSETMRIEYEKTSQGGITGNNERSANTSCSISCRPTVTIFTVSSTENGGKL
jgi:hypothetical protein